MSLTSLTSCNGRLGLIPTQLGPDWEARPVPTPLWTGSAIPRARQVHVPAALPCLSSEAMPSFRHHHGPWGLAVVSPNRRHDYTDSVADQRLPLPEACLDSAFCCKSALPPVSAVCLGRPIFCCAVCCAVWVSFPSVCLIIHLVSSIAVIAVVLFLTSTVTLGALLAPSSLSPYLPLSAVPASSGHHVCAILADGRRRDLAWLSMLGLDCCFVVLFCSVLRWSVLSRVAPAPPPIT